MYLDCTHKLKLQSNKKANFQDLLMCIFKHSYLKQKNDLLYHSCKLEPISNGYQCSRQYKVIMISMKVKLFLIVLILFFFT